MLSREGQGVWEKGREIYEAPSMNQLLCTYLIYISPRFWHIGILAAFYRERRGTEVLDLWPWVI